MKVFNICIIIFLVSLSLTVGIFSVNAYGVGVKKDNYMKWNLNNSIPLLGQTIHQTGWMKLTILSIDGERITATYESHFDPGISGTTPVDEKVTGYIDISTGESDFPLSSTPILGRATSGLIVPAGLASGDSIPGIGDVQGTETHDGRNAVYIVTPGVGTSIETWWDQETGVLLETHFEFPYGSVTGSRTVKLAETNVWGSGFLLADWWLYLAILVIAVAVVSIVAIVTKKRKSIVSPLSPAATKPLSGVLAFAFSCIVGIVSVVWLDQIGGWFMNNYTQSAGSILSGAFGAWWTNGFALIVGLIIGIIGGLLVWILVEEGLPVMNLGAMLSVAVGMFVTLFVGSLLFGLGTWIQNYVETSGGYISPLLVQILSGVGIVIPLIAGGFAAFVAFLVVGGIITSTKKKGHEEEKPTGS